MILELTGQYAVRHMHTWDIFPTSLWAGDKLNTHWVWVAADDRDRPVGALITAPAHGVVMLLRVWLADDAPRHLLLTMLRSAARECKALGMDKWMTFLNASAPNEIRLARIALKCKAVGEGVVAMAYVGRLADVCS